MAKRIEHLYDELLDEVSVEPLDRKLSKALTLGLRLKNDDFSRRVRFELNGYRPGNPAMDADVVLPEYRSVGVWYEDNRGRPLVAKGARRSLSRDIGFGCWAMSLGGFPGS